MDQLDFTLPFVAGAITLLVLIFVYIFYKKKLDKINNEKLDFSKDEVDVPLMASFSGLKNIPHLSLAENSLNPKLKFFKDHLEHRIISLGTKKYATIELVDITIAPFTKNLILIFKNDDATFIGNLYGERNLIDTLRFLNKKGCKLSPKATAWLEEKPNNIFN